MGVFASVALECLITEEDEEPKEITKKKRGRKKKSELLQMKSTERPVRRRLNMVEPGGPFYCESPGCGKFYCRRRELNRHQRYSCLTPPQFQCEFCPLRTSQKYNLITHMRLKHADQFFIGHDLLQMLPWLVTKKCEGVTFCLNWVLCKVLNY